jgi:hypothetical protein
VEALGQQNDSNEWWLFIDSSKLSLKAVLSHNGRIYHSAPILGALHTKTSCDNMRHLLNVSNKINILGISMETWEWQYLCFVYDWAIRNSCFFCEWERSSRRGHYSGTVTNSKNNDSGAKKLSPLSLKRNYRFPQKRQGRESRVICWRIFQCLQIHRIQNNIRNQVFGIDTSIFFQKI